MSDESERKPLLEAIGDEIMECLPECCRTEEVAYSLGSLCGLVVGYLLGRQMVRWLLPRDEGDEK
jgi:hypothetical protein